MSHHNMISPNQLGDFLCPDCDARFQRKHNLEVHKRLHDNLKFKLQFKVYPKQQAKGQSSKKTNFKCNECPIAFMTQNKLNQHIKQSHEKDYFCKSCRVKFSSKNALERHVMACTKPDDDDDDVLIVCEVKTPVKENGNGLENVTDSHKEIRNNGETKNESDLRDISFSSESIGNIYSTPVFWNRSSQNISSANESIDNSKASTSKQNISLDRLQHCSTEKATKSCTKSGDDEILLLCEVKTPFKENREAEDKEDLPTAKETKKISSLSLDNSQHIILREEECNKYATKQLNKDDHWERKKSVKRKVFSLTPEKASTTETEKDDGRPSPVKTSVSFSNTEEVHLGFHRETDTAKRKLINQDSSSGSSTNISINPVSSPVQRKRSPGKNQSPKKITTPFAGTGEIVTDFNREMNIREKRLSNGDAKNESDFRNNSFTCDSFKNVYSSPVLVNRSSHKLHSPKKKTETKNKSDLKNKSANDTIGDEIFNTSKRKRTPDRLQHYISKEKVNSESCIKSKNDDILVVCKVRTPIQENGKSDVPFSGDEEDMPMVKKRSKSSTFLDNSQQKIQLDEVCNNSPIKPLDQHSYQERQNSVERKVLSLTPGKASSKEIGKDNVRLSPVKTSASSLNIEKDSLELHREINVSKRKMLNHNLSSGSHANMSIDPVSPVLKKRSPPKNTALSANKSEIRIDSCRERNIRENRQSSGDGKNESDLRKRLFTNDSFDVCSTPILGNTTSQKLHSPKTTIKNTSDLKSISFANNYIGDIKSSNESSPDKLQHCGAKEKVLNKSCYVKIHRLSESEIKRHQTKLINSTMRTIFDATDEKIVRDGECLQTLTPTKAPNQDSERENASPTYKETSKQEQMLQDTVKKRKNPKMPKKGKKLKKLSEEERCCRRWTKIFDLAREAIRSSNYSMKHMKSSDLFENDQPILKTPRASSTPNIGQDKQRSSTQNANSAVSICLDKQKFSILNTSSTTSERSTSVISQDKQSFNFESESSTLDVSQDMTKSSASNGSSTPTVSQDKQSFNTKSECSAPNISLDKEIASTKNESSSQDTSLDKQIVNTKSGCSTPNVSLDKQSFGNKSGSSTPNVSLDKQKVSTQSESPPNMSQDKQRSSEQNGSSLLNFSQDGQKFNTQSRSPAPSISQDEQKFSAQSPTSIPNIYENNSNNQSKNTPSVCQDKMTHVNFHPEISSNHTTLDYMLQQIKSEEIQQGDGENGEIQDVVKEETWCDENVSYRLNLTETQEAQCDDHDSERTEQITAVSTQCDNGDCEMVQHIQREGTQGSESITEMLHWIKREETQCDQNEKEAAQQITEEETQCNEGIREMLDWIKKEETQYNEIDGNIPIQNYCQVELKTSTDFEDVNRRKRIDEIDNVEWEPFSSIWQEEEMTEVTREEYEAFMSQGEEIKDTTPVENEITPARSEACVSQKKVIEITVAENATCIPQNEVTDMTAAKSKACVPQEEVTEMTPDVPQKVEGEYEVQVSQEEMIEITPAESKVDIFEEEVPETTAGNEAFQEENNMTQGEEQKKNPSTKHGNPKRIKDRSKPKSSRKRTALEDMMEWILDEYLI